MIWGSPRKILRCRTSVGGCCERNGGLVHLQRDEDLPWLGYQCKLDEERATSPGTSRCRSRSKESREIALGGGLGRGPSGSVWRSRWRSKRRRMSIKVGATLGVVGDTTCNGEPERPTQALPHDAHTSFTDESWGCLHLRSSLPFPANRSPDCRPFDHCARNPSRFSSASEKGGLDVGHTFPRASLNFSDPIRFDQTNARSIRPTLHLRLAPRSREPTYPPVDAAYMGRLKLVSGLHGLLRSTLIRTLQNQ